MGLRVLSSVTTELHREAENESNGDRLFTDMLGQPVINAYHVHVGSASHVESKERSTRTALLYSSTSLPPPSRITQNLNIQLQKPPVLTNRLRNIPTSMHHPLVPSPNPITRHSRPKRPPNRHNNSLHIIHRQIRTHAHPTPGPESPEPAPHLFQRELVSGFRSIR